MVRRGGKAPIDVDELAGEILDDLRESISALVRDPSSADSDGKPFAYTELLLFTEDSAQAYFVHGTGGGISDWCAGGADLFTQFDQRLLIQEAKLVARLEEDEWYRFPHQTRTAQVRTLDAIFEKARHGRPSRLELGRSVPLSWRDMSATMAQAVEKLPPDGKVEVLAQLQFTKFALVMCPEAVKDDTSLRRALLSLSGSREAAAEAVGKCNPLHYWQLFQPLHDANGIRGGLYTYVRDPEGRGRDPVEEVNLMLGAIFGEMVHHALDFNARCSGRVRRGQVGTERAIWRALNLFAIRDMTEAQKASYAKARSAASGNPVSAARRIAVEAFMRRYHSEFANVDGRYQADPTASALKLLEHLMFPSESAPSADDKLSMVKEIGGPKPAP